jgi:hypothetical protein
MGIAEALIRPNWGLGHFPSRDPIIPIINRRDREHGI